METLLTVAVPDVDIVLAKYAAAMTVLAGAGAATLLMVAALRPFVPAGSAVDPGPVAAGYLILLLCGGFYASVGLLVSSLTRNHVLAGAVCFPVLGAMFFAEYFGSAFGGPFREAARYVSAPQHILTFAGGLVDSRPVVLYLSGTVFMLFAAVRVLESERWR
jgi:ABC-2 type transport system permease protein